MAQKVLNSAGVSTTKDGKTKALFFISSRQAENLARAAIDGNSDKKELQEMLANDPPSILRYSVVWWQKIQN